MPCPKEKPVSVVRDRIGQQPNLGLFTQERPALRSLRDRLAQLRGVADGKQALWFLERIGLDHKFLGRVCRLIEEAD